MFDKKKKSQIEQRRLQEFRKFKTRFLNKLLIYCSVDLETEIFLSLHLVIVSMDLKITVMTWDRIWKIRLEEFGFFWKSFIELRNTFDWFLVEDVRSHDRQKWEKNVSDQKYIFYSIKIPKFPQPTLENDEENKHTKASLSW